MAWKWFGVGSFSVRNIWQPGAEWRWIVFCRMVERRKASSLISSRDHCQRFLPSQISNTSRARFEPGQNLGSGFVEWSCAVAITTTPRRQNNSKKKTLTTPLTSYSWINSNFTSFTRFAKFILVDVDHLWQISLFHQIQKLACCPFVLNVNLKQS